jgi:hypothetical protein
VSSTTSRIYPSNTPPRAYHENHFAVIDAHAAGEIEPVAIRRIGPDLVFARLWKESGIPDALRSLLKERHYEFDVERAIYLTVLHQQGELPA